MRNFTLGGALLLVLLITSCARVEDGHLVTCKICHKEIENSVRSQYVAIWNRENYRVQRDETYCQVCGDQPVQYNVNIQCQRCGRTYSTLAQHAPRRTEPQDQTRREGYCSDSCRTLAAVETGIDRGSEAVGSLIGRIGRGLAHGIGKHLN